MWRIYKEGQGRWARGVLVFVIMLGAVFALNQLHGSLPKRPEWAIFGVDWRFLVHGPLLLLAGWLGLWLFNRPATADFLIETEGELKNKVTWPSKKEEVNASIVVVVTVLILSTFIFGVDNAFSALSKVIYPGQEESLDAGNCDDGIDNDYDGDTDAEDKDCVTPEAPAAPVTPGAPTPGAPTPGTPAPADQ